MSVKIAAWNVARGLSDARRYKKIEQGVDRLDADVVVMSEAYDRTGEGINPDFAQRLGYTAVCMTEYEDAEPHPSERQYILALSRVAMEADVIRLGSRNALDIELEGGMHVVGAHFDDRTEAVRSGMARSLLEQMDEATPYILAGDLNSMHGRDTRARILRSRIARGVARRLPHDRARSLATRLNEMADGGTMGLLNHHLLVDADPDHLPTMLMAGRVAVAQLDHLLYTPEHMGSYGFRRQRFDGSDHMAISAEFMLRTRPKREDAPRAE